MRRLTARASAVAIIGAMTFASGAAWAASAADWNPKLPWMGYHEAMAKAQAEGKAVCVVAYADWCPRCRALAPKFGAAEVVKASSDLVLVLQDVEKDAPWLKQRYSQTGKYIPRVFFLYPNGNVMDDVTSGNAKFPLFYRASEVPKLVASMRAAASRVKPTVKAAPPATERAATAVARPNAAEGAQAAVTKGASGGLLDGASDWGLLLGLALVAVGLVRWVSARAESQD